MAMRNKWVWTVRVLLIAIAGSGAVVWAQAPVLPASAVVTSSAETDPGAVRLLVGRSTVLDVANPITRVSLTSPDIADALVTSPNQVLINGKLPGIISMFVWDRGGAVKRYEIIVQRDIARLSAQVKQLFPGEQIDVQTNGKNVVLTGIVSSKDVIERAVNVAAGYVDKREEVVPLLQLQDAPPSVQVLLHVRFAEVSRSALTQLGSTFFTGPGGVQGQGTVAQTSTQQFSTPSFSPLTAGAGPSGSGAGTTTQTFSDFLNLFLFNSKYNVGTVISALQSKGLIQSLAEPNLVAESGKEASFLAGGEFPVPIAQGSGGILAVTVTFKEFGIRLSFTPTVIGNRIHLKVKPEVSTLDFADGVTLNGFTIPALSTRRTETELELENHQTFAIAGLMNNTVNSTMTKIPGIGDIPILGQLFRSKQAQKNQTELVVIITPEILPNNSPGAASTLPRTPDQFLPPLSEKGTVAPPPPPFQSDRSAGDAAAAVAALTPSGPRMADPLPVVTPAAPAQVADAPRPLTANEQKTIERVRSQELAKAQDLAREQAKADAKANAAEAKRQAEQAQADARFAVKAQAKEDQVARDEAKKQEQLAREQAKRDAAAVQDSHP
jgi:pilus assembly protein CpaC